MAGRRLGGGGDDTAAMRDAMVPVYDYATRSVSFHASRRPGMHSNSTGDTRELCVSTENCLHIDFGNSRSGHPRIVTVSESAGSRSPRVDY